MRRLASALVIVSVMLIGCRQDRAAPPYVRLSGPAPVVEDVPPTRALLVVFWAVWCEPCRHETPALRALAASPPEGLAVVVAGHDATIATVEQFLGSSPDESWHFRLDTDKKLADAFGVAALPASYLVVDGQLVARFVGPRDWDSRAVRGLLEKLIDEPAR